MDQILAESTTHGEKISSVDFYESLRQVIVDMDFIKKEVMEIKEKMEVQDKLERNSTLVAGSLRYSTGQFKNTMVGFDDVLLEIIDKLTGGELDRQIISIVGMGGIGKTTLARNICQNKAVMQHFDVLVWVTISLEYRMREILLELLQERGGKLSQMNEYDLGDKLHKKLSKRRHLIMMDDIWDVEVWDQLQLFFPDNKNGSRIMLTTRLLNLASHVTGSRCINMAFLDKDNSWNLFSKIVFGKKGCPVELEEIGRRIVENCKGLPLSIVVIGGLLANCKHRQEYWEYIEENLNSVVNSQDNESCLKILHMSYNQLPVHLKPCFLYMGVFEEDSRIRVPMLTKLWVAEGFLKPISGKSLEEIAEDYLKELVDRNLILVVLGPIGGIKYCKIHDLLRDLCLREAQKGRFYYVIRQHSPKVPQDKNTQRRIVIPKRTSKDKVLDALQSVSLVRSLLCNIEGVRPLPNLRLLRIWKPFVNLRCLFIYSYGFTEYPFSVDLFWNLDTVRVESFHYTELEIWNIPHLRYVDFGKCSLLDTPSGNLGGRDDIVLRNLVTLKRITNFKLGEEVVKRIPNVKKLFLEYDFESESVLPDYSLNNLERLQKLESFSCYFYSDETKQISATDILQNATFPHSLKKLKLYYERIQWEDILEKIGSLPLLENLQLLWGSFRECKWETVDRQFRSLKFLLICVDNLEYWTMESSHFPCLEHLVLRTLKELKEIPLEIGEIPTLKSIEFHHCSDSAIISAKRVQEEQEELQGEVGFQVRVVHSKGRKNEALESLASPNFQFDWY